MPWYDFANTLLSNAWYGPSTGTISDKYPLKITPTDETFSIWIVIYYGLAEFLWSSDLNTETRELFKTSMSLNRDWIEAFTSEDLTRALDIMKQLRQTNDLLDNSVENHYIEMYAVWVRIAAVLNECIVETYVNQKKDTSLEKLKNLLNDTSMTDVEKQTLRWAIQGITRKQNYTIQDDSTLREIKMRLGVKNEPETNATFVVTRRFRKEKMIEANDIGLNATPLTKDNPPTKIILTYTSDHFERQFERVAVTEKNACYLKYDESYYVPSDPTTLRCYPKKSPVTSDFVLGRIDVIICDYEIKVQGYQPPEKVTLNDLKKSFSPDL